MQNDMRCITVTDTYCLVRVKVAGVLCCRSFSFKKFGGVEKATRAAKRYRDIRKSTKQAPITGKSKVYESVSKVKGIHYLYVCCKQPYYKSLCVGRIENTNEYKQNVRQLSKYKDMVDELSTEVQRC